jgi:hypothetical protein
MMKLKSFFSNTFYALLFMIVAASCTSGLDKQGDHSKSQTSRSEREREVVSRITGAWKWAVITENNSGKQYSIEEFSKGETKGVKIYYYDDYTYAEKDFRENTKETKGNWKLEEDGTVLSAAPETQQDNWKSRKILKLTDDSMVLKMSDQYNLVLVKATE